MSDLVFRGVRLSHPEKVLYPEQGITKRAMAEYYEGVADWMLPHVVNRPISLVRCPAGRTKKCFFQRHAGSGVPPQLSEVPIEGFDDSEAFLYIKNISGLMALVQMGVLEMHPWGSRVDNPMKPDRMVFDLDPGAGLSFKDVVAAAKDVRQLLKQLGLTSFPKTTGGKGLHVVTPIARRYSWADVKTFAKRVGELMTEKSPELYLTRISIAERRGKIFIDYLRNDPTSTAVGPYSTRAREGAPVATPLDWDELTPKLNPKAFDIRTVSKRLPKLKSDPWEGIANLAQKLPALSP
ncbi:MAG TPA: non-homologous end-joining DNA ligase [Rhizomicrobium sp.]|jgi:bifunctional non-homologous end joining protein LigD|nr:non-homologous end-joining DNA ligase [Rhizomicrobium sp.]